MAHPTFLESSPNPRGLTLVEMIIVLAIISIITVVVLVGQRSFDSSITLTDAAYTVALSVRQAQSYGLSSKIYNSISNAAYGVHFDSTSPGTYVFFADTNPGVPGTPSSFCPGHTGDASSPEAKPGNCYYDSPSVERIQTYTFNRGFTISSICGKDTSGIQHCAGSGGDLTGIDVLYMRPNTDSVITGLRTSGNGGNLALTQAQFTLSTPQGGARYICVTAVGEVSVAITTCP